MTQLTFDFDVVDAWAGIYNQLNTCRDCGRTKFTWASGCGGAGPATGTYALCDDCAALEGVGERGDGTTDVSRWGIRTTTDERERLTTLQRQRQAAWLRAHPT